MYIGDVHDGTGLHHMVWEVIDNAVDEHLAGHCHNVLVVVHADGSLTVRDDGRGIPVGIMADRGVSAAEVVMTVLHAGGKFDNDSYKVSAGLHGVGVSAVNAVSEYLKLEIYREGKTHFQEYRKGVPQLPLAVLGNTERTGTRITFKPDGDIFSSTEFSYEILNNRLREISFLNAGLRIELEDERDERKTEYHFEGGIMEFVSQLNKSRQALHDDVIRVRDTRDNVEVDIALQWSDAYSEQILCYTNNVANKDGGTHLTGLRTALTRLINSYGEKHGLLKELKGSAMSGEDTREGLTAILSIKHPDPSFDSQTKSKLVSSEVKGIVEQVLGERLSSFLEENPQTAKKIIAKTLIAAKAREAARKAREMVQRKGVLDIRAPRQARRLSGARRRQERLVHRRGRLGRGSAKQGRDRRFQAILPLRARLNVRARALREDALERRDRHADHRARLRRRRRRQLRHREAALPPDHPDDGCRRRRLAHPHAAVDVLLPSDGGRHPQGYLYIAQPPLYKVSAARRSSSSRTTSPQPLPFDAGIDGLIVRTASGGAPLAGDPLRRLVEDLGRFRALLSKLGRKQDARVIEAFVRSTDLAARRARRGQRTGERA